MNRYALFNGNTKMGEAILSNHTLLTVLPRFGVKLGFGEKSIKKICLDNNIDENTFIMMCNIHTFDNYTPSQDELNSVDIESVLSYLRNSHRYYVERRISNLESRLAALSSQLSITHHRIIDTFLREYKNEIMNHFKYEDEVVFPYINRLIAKEDISGFDIAKYEENHDNIDDKLNDLKNILIKYIPEEYSTDDCNDLLRDIFLFENDIDKHTRIEERVVVPIVKTIEEEYDK